MKATPSKILYVDDDSDDCVFLSESLMATGTQADLVYAADGEEAIRYLNSVTGASLPSLIILDLNMPRWDGRKTLNYLKSVPALASIPVVILSTSRNERDMAACASMGAASYLQKPYHYEGYREIIRSFMPLMKD